MEQLRKAIPAPLLLPSSFPVKVQAPMSLLSGNLDYTMPYMKRALPWMTPLRIML